MRLNLSLDQQRALLKALSPAKKKACRLACCKCVQQGEGIKDVFKKISKILGPVAKAVGPTVLKEFVAPYLKRKATGGALRLAGTRT